MVVDLHLTPLYILGKLALDVEFLPSRCLCIKEPEVIKVFLALSSIHDYVVFDNFCRSKMSGLWAGLQVTELPFGGHNIININLVKILLSIPAIEHVKLVFVGFHTVSTPPRGNIA